MQDTKHYFSLSQKSFERLLGEGGFVISRRVLLKQKYLANSQYRTEKVKIDLWGPKNDPKRPTCGNIGKALRNFMPGFCRKSITLKLYSLIKVPLYSINQSKNKQRQLVWFIIERYFRCVLNPLPARFIGKVRTFLDVVASNLFERIQL